MIFRLPTHSPWSNQLSSSNHRGTQPSGDSDPQASSVRSEIKELLRSEGLRATRARIAVLVVLHEKAVPMSHQQIMDQLSDNSDKATVWRLLADLSERGILRRMDLGDRVWRYELYDKCRSVSDDHPHLLCEDCGDVQCLPPLEVRAKDGSLPLLLVDADFKIRVTGRCGDCAAA